MLDLWHHTPKVPCNVMSRGRPRVHFVTEVSAMSKFWVQAVTSFAVVFTCVILLGPLGLIPGIVIVALLP